MVKPILLTMMLVCCASAQAQVYKWTDAKGNINYSAIPPLQGSYETIQKSPSPSQNPSAIMQDLQRKVETVDRAREQAQQQEQANQDEAAKRTANCDQAKANLQTLESDKLVFRVDAKGNKAPIEGQQREQAINQARKDVGYFCTP